MTLANENTEEEPMAPVGRRSDHRKSVSSRYCILGKLPNCRVSSIHKYIVQRKQPDQHPGRDGREEQCRQSGTAVRLHRLQLQQRVAEGPGRPLEDMRHSWEEEKQEQRERRRIEDGGGEDRTAY